MAISASRITALERNVPKIPIGKIICVATAALRFYKCWTTTQSDTCIKTFIKDVEACLR